MHDVISSFAEVHLKTVSRIIARCHCYTLPRFISDPCRKAGHIVWVAIILIYLASIDLPWLVSSTDGTVAEWQDLAPSVQSNGKCSCSHDLCECCQHVNIKELKIKSDGESRKLIRKSMVHVFFIFLTEEYSRFEIPRNKTKSTQPFISRFKNLHWDDGFSCLRWGGPFTVFHKNELTRLAGIKWISLLEKRSATSALKITLYYFIFICMKNYLSID